MAGVGVARCLAALTAAWVVCGIALAGAAQAQGQDDLALLRAEVFRLSGLSKYAQALPIAQRYVELTSQKHGENHPAFAEAVTLLGSISWAQGRFAEAERHHKRSLAIFETTLGREHPNVATVLNGLAGIYWSQRRYTEAEPLAKRSLAILDSTAQCETRSARAPA
jgi:tetratricopeptide (TPR) repeat protein